MQTVITWNKITIEITYTRSYSPEYEKIYGYPLAHLELRADDPLPVTGSGYRSLFTPAPEIEDRRGAEAFTKAWLDSAAQDPAWKKQAQARKQLSLF
jgi:hypothetical protein